MLSRSFDHFIKDSVLSITSQSSKNSTISILLCLFHHLFNCILNYNYIIILKICRNQLVTFINMILLIGIEKESLMNTQGINSAAHAATLKGKINALEVSN